MSSDELDVSVNTEGFAAAPVPLLEGAVRTALAHAGISEGEVSVTLLDDGGIRALNARWLQRDHPTDVIAFSLGGDGPVLGDVYVGWEQAARQAEEAGVSVAEELVRLAIHGTLHVLGHDHPDGDERADSPMFALQEALVRSVLEDSSPA